MGCLCRLMVEGGMQFLLSAKATITLMNMIVLKEASKGSNFANDLGIGCSWRP